MKEKKVTIDGKEYVVKELNWEERMSLLDEGWTTKKYMAYALKSPNIKDNPNVFIEMETVVGSILLEEINKLNKLDEEKKKTVIVQ